MACRIIEGDGSRVRFEKDGDVETLHRPQPENEAKRYQVRAARAYFRKPADLSMVNELDAYRGVEFKSLGRQVVAAGSVHPETGRLYALDDDVLRMELSEAPEASEKLLRAIEKVSVSASEDRSGRDHGPTVGAAAPEAGRHGLQRPS